MKKWIIIMILVIAMTSSQAIAQGFGNCAFGDYTFGDCTLPEEEKDVGGGVKTILNVDAQPALSTKNCTEGNQYFEGACFPCEVNGSLYKRVDNSVVCVTCNEGYEYDGYGGCQTAKDFIFKWGQKISPLNPFVGIILITITMGGIGYWSYQKVTVKGFDSWFYGLFRKEKEKKKEEDDEEDDL